MSDDSVYFEITSGTPAAEYCKPFEDQLMKSNAATYGMHKLLTQEFKLKKADKLEFYHSSDMMVSGFRFEHCIGAIKAYSEKYPKTFRYKSSTRHNPGFATWYASAKEGSNKEVLLKIRAILKDMPEARPDYLWPLIGQPAGKCIWMGLSMLRSPGYLFSGKKLKYITAGINGLTDQKTGKPTKLMEGVTPSRKAKCVNSERRYKELKQVIRRKLKERQETVTAGGRTDSEDLFA